MKIAPLLKNLRQIVIFMGSKWKNEQEGVTRTDYKRWILIANFSKGLTLPMVLQAQLQRSNFSLLSTYSCLSPHHYSASPRPRSQAVRLSFRSLLPTFRFPVPSRLKSLAFVLVPVLPPHLRSLAILNFYHSYLAKPQFHFIFLVHFICKS